MDQGLIGPGVVEGRGHVHVPIRQNEQRPLETGENTEAVEPCIMGGDGVSSLPYLNCPADMLSPVNRLFLASRRFSRSFLSNFWKTPRAEGVMTLLHQTLKPYQLSLEPPASASDSSWTHHSDHLGCISSGAADDRHRA